MQQISAHVHQILHGVVDRPRMQLFLADLTTAHFELSWASWQYPRLSGIVESCNSFELSGAWFPLIGASRQRWSPFD